MRKTLWVATIGLLFTSGVLGTLNGLREFGDGRNWLQQSVLLGSLVYGVAGIGAGWLLARRRTRAVAWSLVWGLFVTWVATMATFVFNRGTFVTSDVLPGTFAALISCSLLSAGVVWVARRSVHIPASPTHADASAAPHK